MPQLRREHIIHVTPEENLEIQAWLKEQDNLDRERRGDRPHHGFTLDASGILVEADHYVYDRSYLH